MTSPRLLVQSVSKAYGAVHALRGVSLTALPGEVHALLGENGAGKSTLMKVLSGAIACDDGTIELDGSRFAPKHPRDAQDRGVAMVYQEPQVCPHLTVLENIFLGREKSSRGILRRRDMEDAANELTRSLVPGGLPARALAGELSPGDQQVLAIARALSQDPKVLILDEPTSSLSLPEVERLFAAVEKLKKTNITILYISHFLEEVERIADRFTVLRDGETVGSGRIGDVPMNDVIELMVGQPPEEQYPPIGPRNPGATLLEVKNVAGRDNPQAGSFVLRRGEVLGLAGLVGSGRTELLRLIYGLDPVVRGTVKVGHYSGRRSPYKSLQQKMGLLSEDRKTEGLAARMSIAENITLSNLSGLGPWGFIWPPNELRKVRAWMSRLSVKADHPEQPVSSLSGGNQQKVALGRLLYHEVDVLLLDEPTRGIDVRSRSEIYKLIDSLASKGCAVLMVSSYLPELFGVCDRIAVMHRGTLGEVRPTAERDPKEVLAEALGA